jgi:hypothetical protein
VCLEGEVVEAGTNHALAVEVPQLIMTVKLSRPDDHVGSWIAIGTFDIEHLAVHFTHDEETSTVLNAYKNVILLTIATLTEEA